MCSPWSSLSLQHSCRSNVSAHALVTAIGAILAKCGVTSIRTMVLLMGGVAVDELKKEPAKLPKLKGLKISRTVRRGIVKALSASSWFALLGVFR